jgi:hypothetical protein
LITTTTLFVATGENDDDHFGFAVTGQWRSGWRWLCRFCCRCA